MRLVVSSTDYKFSKAEIICRYIKSGTDIKKMILKAISNPSDNYVKDEYEHNHEA